VQHLYQQPGTEVPFITNSNQSTQHKTGFRKADITVFGVNGRDFGSPVFITKDGYSWHEIIRFSGSYTTRRVCGPDNNGIIYGSGTNDYVFKKPFWIEQ